MKLLYKPCVFPAAALLACRLHGYLDVTAAAGAGALLPVLLRAAAARLSRVLQDSLRLCFLAAALGLLSQDWNIHPSKQNRMQS